MFRFPNDWAENWNVYLLLMVLEDKYLYKFWMEYQNNLTRLMVFQEPRLEEMWKFRDKNLKQGRDQAIWLRNDNRPIRFSGWEPICHLDLFSCPVTGPVKRNSTHLTLKYFASADPGAAEFCSPPSHFSGFLQPFYGLFSSRICPGLTAFSPIMFYFLLISTCNISGIFLLGLLLSLLSRKVGFKKNEGPKLGFFLDIAFCFILPFSIWKAIPTAH